MQEHCREENDCKQADAAGGFHFGGGPPAQRVPILQSWHFTVMHFEHNAHLVCLFE